jgi:anti-sigma B factor antagonist
MPLDKLTMTVLETSSETERILKLAGPLTLTTIIDFRDRVLSAKTAKTFILDCSEISYIDSSGIGAIVSTHAACANSGRRLALVGLTDRIHALMKVSWAEQVLSIYPTLQEAQQALAKA